VKVSAWLHLDIGVIITQQTPLLKATFSPAGPTGPDGPLTPVSPCKKFPD